MEYRATFYRTESGDKPVVEFRESLRRTNEPFHEPLTAGVRKPKHRDNHGRPLTAPVGEAAGIMELRVGHAGIARVRFFVREGRGDRAHERVRQEDAKARSGRDRTGEAIPGGLGAPLSGGTGAE